MKRLLLILLVWPTCCYSADSTEITKALAATKAAEIRLLRTSMQRTPSLQQRKAINARILEIQRYRGTYIPVLQDNLIREGAAGTIPVTLDVMGIDDGGVILRTPTDGPAPRRRLPVQGEGRFITSGPSQGQGAHFFYVSGLAIDGLKPGSTFNLKSPVLLGKRREVHWGTNNSRRHEAIEATVFKVTDIEQAERKQ